MTVFIDFFPDSGVPEKPILNSHVMEAVSILLLKYRNHNNIQEWEVLTEEKIEEVLRGVKRVIYKHEGIR